MSQKISVIIPIYNSEKYLKETIESILNQTYKNLEIILINDGSKDDSLEIIKEYKTKDERIKIIDQKNAGVSAARNIGIKNATGDFIAFNDADDISMPERFDRQISEFKKDKDLKICGAKANLINEFNIKIGAFEYPPLLDKEIKIKSIYKYPFITSTLMIRKDILKDDKKKEESLFDTKIKFAEDYEFITKYIYKYKCKNIDSHLINYRIHTAQATNKKLKMKVGAMKMRILALFRFLKYKLFLK